MSNDNQATPEEREDMRMVALSLEGAAEDIDYRRNKPLNANLLRKAAKLLKFAATALEER